jgi:hypothetical protein
VTRQAAYPRESVRTVDFRYAPRDGWTLICRPDDPHKTLVRQDGALLYDFDGRNVDVARFDTVLELSAETAYSPMDIRQRTESPARPIVVTTVRYPDQTLELVAFGHEHDGRRTDVVLWRITAAAHADEVLAGLHIEPYLRTGAWAAAADPEPANALHRVAAGEPLVLPPEGTDGIPRLRPGTDAPCILRSVPQTLSEVHARGFRPAGAAMTTPTLLRGGESTSGAVLVPLDHDDVAALDLEWARRALEREREVWDSVELVPRWIEVPDRDVQDLLTACSRNILQARELEHGAPILHVGPTIYRGLWLVDGHFLLEAARYLGFDDAADAGLEALLRRVKPDGSIAEIEHVPHIKETGIAIATLVRQAELSGDRDRLRRQWPIVQAAVAHIERLRDQARALPADHPLHGLMPEAFGDGGVADARPEYTTAAWTLTGLRFAVRGAELLDAPADVERFSLAYEELRRAFEISAQAQRAALPGGVGNYLPMAAPTSGAHQFLVGVAAGEVPRWREIQPETATWAMCHAIWPGEAFDPDGVWVQDLLELFDARDDEEGIPATTGWLAYRGVWTYAASFAAHVWLYAGRPDRAIDYLYAFANHAYPTRVWREEQALRSAGNRYVWGDMPHNWASAEMIRLVRHLLVFERDRDLDVLPALPDRWTEAGCRIHLDRTPTRFGAVTLTVEATERELEIALERRSAGHPDPGRVRLFVPSRFRGEVVVDGAPADLAGGDHVELALRDAAAVTVEARG